MTFDPTTASLALNRRVCFFGDSLVNGTGDPQFRGWPGRILELAAGRGHHATCYNLGVRGDTSREVAARWREETARRIAEIHRSFCVFSFGMNDCIVIDGAERVPAEESVANLAALVSESAMVSPTLMIGPSPIDCASTNARATRIDRLYGQTCAGIGVPYLSVFERLARSPAWLDEIRRIDGAHPQAAGYQVYAGLIDAWPAWRAWFP